jgi:hypothetical protein
VRTDHSTDSGHLLGSTSLRRLILWGGAAALTATLGIVAVGAWQYTRADINTVGDLDFANPLTTSQPGRCFSCSSPGLSVSPTGGATASTASGPPGGRSSPGQPN